MHKFGSDTQCVCSRFAEAVPPDGWSACGHIAATGMTLKCSKRLQELLSRNLNEPIWPDKAAFVEGLVTGVVRYLKDNEIPLAGILSQAQIRSRILAVADKEWNAHCAYRSIRANSGGPTLAAVKKVREEFSGLVWDCEDHAYTRAVAYCPQLYASMIHRTFVQDRSVFAPVPLSPECATELLLSSVPKSLRDDCS